MEPAPLSYATCIGKYPAKSEIIPMRPANLGLFLSVIMPIGMPDAYMPRFAAVPCMCSVERYKGRGIVVQ